MSLLNIRDLAVQAPGTDTLLPLLDHIDIDIPEHETTGLTGPSGCGKTLLAKSITGLLPHNLTITSGTFKYKGKKILRDNLDNYRGSTFFYTPQNPAAALNPVRKIKYQLAETLNPLPSLKQSIELLAELQISSPARVLNSYPFQLSGGECQRVVLAMALLRKPRLLILDEPVASLDTAASEHFLNLLHLIKNKHHLTVLLITHHIPTLYEYCSILYQMEKGKLSPSAS